MRFNGTLSCDYTIYPIPASEKNEIKISSKIDANVDITVQNSEGQVITNYSTSFLKSGVYKLNMNTKLIGIGYVTLVDQFGTVSRFKIVVQ